MKRRIRFETLAMLAVALLLVIASAPYAQHYLETRKCGKHLAMISQAAQVWAKAHDGRLPSEFIVMSNELVAPRLLHCPGDKSREPADNWQAFRSVNNSYQMWEGTTPLALAEWSNAMRPWADAPTANARLAMLVASGAKDLPVEILQKVDYLRCKVHGGNYANALGKVSVYSRPIPLTIGFLAGLAIVAFLGRGLWHHYKPVQGQLPSGTAAGDLLPRIEQVRRNYLAARGRGPSPWYRKGLLPIARQALRALAFFADRKRDPPGRENPRIP
jgi:hypothetical protein